MLSLFFAFVLMLSAAGCAAPTETVSETVSEEIQTPTETLAQLTDAQLQAVTDRIFRSYPSAGGAIWGDGFAWEDILEAESDGRKGYVAYFTVLEKAKGETDGFSYYNIRIDECIVGNLKEGTILTVSHQGSYDEASGFRDMLSPFITPPEIGKQWLTRFLPAHETNPNAGQLAASFAGGGYVEEIGGKTYVVFRSVSDRPVSGPAAYLSRRITASSGLKRTIRTIRWTII